MKTQGQIEPEISDAIIRFEKDYMGRGPMEARTYILDDMILVRLKGVLTPAERKLASDDAGFEGRELIKQVRLKLVERGRTLLESLIQGNTGATVVSLHTDISTRTGERVIVFALSKPLRITGENLEGRSA
jgi:uncharacterized protein YbcI